MLNLIQDIEFIESNGIYLVQGIQAWDVFSVSFDNIDYIVLCGIAFKTNISIIYFVFFQYGFNCLVAYFISVNHSRNNYSALVFLFKIYIWWAFV